MVKLDLQIAARLENLNAIKLPMDADWYFKTRCGSCNEVHENVISFKLTELQELPGSKGLATYAAKCKMCNRSGNIEYCKNTWSEYTEQSNEEWKTIATFECRGMDLCEFMIGNDWCAQSNKSDSVFGHGAGQEPMEFDGPDWCGYDEEGEDSVGVYEFRSQFVRSKK